MSSIDIKKVLYDKYILPTRREKSKLIGLEIEMPIVTLDGSPVDYSVTQSVFEEFIKSSGFKPVKYDENGICFNAINPETGDDFSFDCSYSNLEISFSPADNINVIDSRFRSYVGALNELFIKKNHIITGMGVNPYYKINRADFIPFGRYTMLEQYLKKAGSWDDKMYFHNYAGFGAYASSEQVQLDVEEHEIPEVIKAFSLLEPIKAVLFSNSVMEDEPSLLCTRDLFWENSTHGINSHNIGAYECEINSTDELIEYIAGTSIFCAERNGHYLFFHPVPIQEYLDMETIIGEYYEDGTMKNLSFTPCEEDISYLRTYKFEDLTFRGTFEFRSCCCQPLEEAMTVPAFHVGAMRKIKEITALLENDTVLYHHGFNDSELRKLMNKRSWPSFVDGDALSALCIEVLDIINDTLVSRGLGEEKYLAPLYERAKTLKSPGRIYVESIEAGKPVSEIIRDFSLKG